MMVDDGLDLELTKPPHICWESCGFHYYSAVHDLWKNGLIVAWKFQLFAHYSILFHYLETYRKALNIYDVCQVYSFEYVSNIK